MKNFNFQCGTKIIYGRDTENLAGGEISALKGSKVLLHYGSGSIKKTGLYEKVIRSLNKNKMEFIELPGVLPNPRISLVKKGISICRKKSIDFILAVGGGSAIDSAKAISAGALYDGDVWDFFCGKARAEKVIGIGAILTIAAAGSETSKISVITNEELGLKNSYASDLLRPKFAILNPEVSFTVPDYHKFCGVIDIMAHIIERYFGKNDYIGLTDLYSEAALKNTVSHALEIKENPLDYKSHGELMWTGTIAQNDLLSAGVNSGFEVHKIEHHLSAIYDISHGGGLAVLLPAWMRYVYKKMPVKFSRFASEVWSVKEDSKSEADIALEGIKSFESFIGKIGLPLTLGKMGVPEERFEEIASRTTENGPLGTVSKLAAEDVLNILKSCR